MILHHKPGQGGAEELSFYTGTDAGSKQCACYFKHQNSGAEVI